jgi:hypothetical protein
MQKNTFKCNTTSTVLKKYLLITYKNTYFKLPKDSQVGFYLKPTLKLIYHEKKYYLSIY